MINKPDFIGDPSGRVYDIRHLKNPQNQYSDQDYETQYAACLKKIETDNEMYKRFRDNFKNSKNTSIFVPIGILIMIILISLKMLFH